MTYASSATQRSPQAHDQSCMTSGWQVIQRALASVGHRAIALLADHPEPHISCHTHANGEFSWRVYDPHTGRSMTYSSEADVRHWLEARYSSMGSWDGRVAYDWRSPFR